MELDEGFEPHSPKSEPPNLELDPEDESNNVELFRLLVYSRYIVLSRFKLVGNVEDKKEFLILHGSHGSIYNMKSKILKGSEESSDIKEVKSGYNKEFEDLLNSFKTYDSMLGSKSEDPCKLKVPTDESTNISIDYKSLKRTVTAKDVVLSKLDPNDGFTLENCLEMMKSKYKYDFTTLVSHWNVIYQIFLYNDHEVQIMTKDKRNKEQQISNPLKLNDEVPTIHYVYSKIAKYRSDLSDKITQPHSLRMSEVRGSDSEYTENIKIKTEKTQNDTKFLNSFESLVTKVNEILTNNDILLNIKILKMNKASVREVAEAIRPVFKEVLVETELSECNFYSWINLFSEKYGLYENQTLEKVYKALHKVLEFSFSYNLHKLTELVVDVIFSFSIRNANFRDLLESLIKYFKTVLLPSTLNYVSDLSTSKEESYSDICIPNLPDLESVLSFEYLALQYPLMERKSKKSKTKKLWSTIPKIGTFVIRIDLEITDKVDFKKLYQKSPESFNFKMSIKNQDKNDKTTMVIRSHGNNFFVSDPETRVFNPGFNFISLEILFNQYSATVFTNGSFFDKVLFSRDKLNFFKMLITYNPENVNIRQYFKLSPGFRKYLIRLDLIHNHIFTKDNEFSAIKLNTSRSKEGGNFESLETSRSELEKEGYIRKVFEHFSFFSMVLSSLHTTIANINFNIQMGTTVNKLNITAFESLTTLFELLLNLFELVSDLTENADLVMLPTVASVNLITLFRLVAESIISALSIVKIFFSFPFKGEVSMNFLKNLSQILVESIRFTTVFEVGPEVYKYHHPIDLISLANTINTTSITIMASNPVILKHLFSNVQINLLSEILLSIAYSNNYYDSDLKIILKNETINTLQESNCIEIFTKRALLHIVESKDINYKVIFGNKMSNFWWNIIYELLETDKMDLNKELVKGEIECTCNQSVNESSLLDPMFSYCVTCLRKYFNYFSSITSLNYHMTKFYTSEAFYSIPKPSMMICRLLLKHGMIIMLFNSYCCKYNEVPSIGDNSEDNQKNNAQQDSIDSGDSGAQSIFEDYYHTMFEPKNLQFIENMFVYLMKTKEYILSSITNRMEILSKYILDQFGLMLHNFISCLSLLDLLSYYSEFMELVRARNAHLFHVVCASCINLIPFLIKVLLMYNRIFKTYSTKYQKFSPFMNYLVFQFSSLLVVFMKFVHFVYVNTDKLDYEEVNNTTRIQGNQKANTSEEELDLSTLKDPQYKFKLPKCVTSKLDFNFQKVKETAKKPRTIRISTFEEEYTTILGCEAEETIPEEEKLEIFQSIRRLLILVQDFKYVKGKSVSFKNISEIDYFISNTVQNKQNESQINKLSLGLMNMEPWAVDLMADYVNPVHPHLIKTQYSLLALFIHLLSQNKREEWSKLEKLGYQNQTNDRNNIITDAVKYSNQISIKIMSKCQTMNTIQTIKDKDKMREAYLEEVRKRCSWIIVNSTEGTYSNEQLRNKHGQKEHYSNVIEEEENEAYNKSKVRTTTLKLVDFLDNKVEKKETTLRRLNSCMQLNIDSGINEMKGEEKTYQKSKSITTELFNKSVPQIQERKKNYNQALEIDIEEILDFVINGPSEEVCEKKFFIQKLTCLVRIAMLSSINTLIYSFLDVKYSGGTGSFRYNFRPLVLDLIFDFQEIEMEESKEETTMEGIVPTNMNHTLELFWYIVLQKLRSIVLCTMKESKFEVVNGSKVIHNIYSRVTNEYLEGILENVCDWYIRSGITELDSTNYTKVNLNFWLGISLSFFSMLYSLGLEPMTDSRYSYQIFNHLFSILHPLPMSQLKQAMSKQTSLSSYTIETALVVYISNEFVANSKETVANLFSCLKTRKFTKKDEITIEEGTLYLLTRKSLKLPDLIKSEQPSNLKFRHLWSFPKISMTNYGSGQFLIYNFDKISTMEQFEGNVTQTSGMGTMRSPRSTTNYMKMEYNDIILWRMENLWYMISEVSLSKKTSNNLVLNINSSTEINVYLTLSKSLTPKKTTEIELALVNYLGGSLEVEGINNTWSQVVGFTRFDDLYKMRVHLYHLMKYLIWVELGTNLYSEGGSFTNENMGLVLKILFKYLRNTALQIFKLSSSCNCKDNTDNVSIKYKCSNISTGFKYSKDIQGFLVDSEEYMDKPLISTGCSICSTNLIYKREMDFFWGNILSSLVDLVSFCNNYNLVYLVMHSLLTTFTLGERQVQSFLSMDYLGQRFCNLLVVSIKQLSSTSMKPGQNMESAKEEKNKNYGINNFTYIKHLLASPKIHGVFVLKWLPPLKQVPMECIYATLRENFQSILISKPFKPTANIEPNDPFVTLPHSEHFVTHRNSADFEADITGNTLQVIRANNMGGIVMYRIPNNLGSNLIQLSTNFYIANGSRFGITVAPADCVFGTVLDLFERNDVVGFSHSNSPPFASQVFAATIGYSVGDILTAHFTIDHQEDGQLCLRTELLIGGNSIGSVLEVVFDPITQNDLSRRMSLVFIFHDPATIILQGSSINTTMGGQNVQMSSQQGINNSGMTTINENNIINTFLTSNLRRDRLNTNSTTDRPATISGGDIQASTPSSDRITGTHSIDRLVPNNTEVVRTLDRLVSRETSGTARTVSVSEASIPVSVPDNNLTEDQENLREYSESASNSDMESVLDDNQLIFNYEKYFHCEETSTSNTYFETIPEWDVNFDNFENESAEQVSLKPCKDEYWDSLLREDKYTCFFGFFSDSIQIYQSVLSVNVPMFSGIKHEVVSKVSSCFEDLYTVLTSNFKYRTLESTVRDCFSWLCVLCCDYDRQVWDKISTREFKVVSDFTLPFLMGSSFPSRTTLVSLSNELLLELLNSISRILTIRSVIMTMSLCSTKKGSDKFMNGEVLVDSLVMAIGSKCLLASTLILKILAHRSYTVDLFKPVKNGTNTTSEQETIEETTVKASKDNKVELVEGIVDFIVYFLSCCTDDLVSFSNTTENVTLSKLESILRILGLDTNQINTQTSYKTHNNTLQSVELVVLDDLWNTIYNGTPNYDFMENIIETILYEKKIRSNENINKDLNVKMFATSDKNYHYPSKIPSVRRHIMRRSQFYKLVEHDIFDLLQNLVQVFSSYFREKILNRCTTTLSLFRASLVHFSSTLDSQMLDYWDTATMDTNLYRKESFKTKMDLFSRASDPLYSWNLLIYSSYESKGEEQEKIRRVLMTELTYCLVLAISSSSFVNLSECVYWILDTLVRHPLSPYDLRSDLTNKSTINLLHLLFLKGVASPPKLAEVSCRITQNIIPSLKEQEIKQMLFLSMHFGTSSFLRVHSVCNFYASSDLDMFTNFDNKRHDHKTRLSTASILHSFLTSFVLLLEELNRLEEEGPRVNTGKLWDEKYSDFYNMGLYLYLARNKRLTKSMVSGLLSIPIQLSAKFTRRTNIKGETKEISPFEYSGTKETTSVSYQTLSPKPGTPTNYMERIIKKSTSPTRFSPSNRMETSKTTLNLEPKQANLQEGDPEVYFVSCSSRYFGLVLNMGVTTQTRFVFSQYRDFSKVLAELVVSPSKTMEPNQGFSLLDEYTVNVPFIKYKLNLNPSYAYRIGYTKPEYLEEETSFHTNNQVYVSENQVYLVTNEKQVEMYIRNAHILWESSSKVWSTNQFDTKGVLPFIETQKSKTGEVNNNHDTQLSPEKILLDYEVIIPVNSCFIKAHEDKFVLRKIEQGSLLTPAIRTGLSVHKPKVLFTNVTPIDLNSSALVSMKTDLLWNVTKESTLKFDPCLPFRVDFKFDKGFDSETRNSFYVGLISRSEQLIWYSNGDLFVQTNFHVPSKNNEYRKLRCLPYSEGDIISITFDPSNSSLYFSNNETTTKLNFFNYYYHITNVHTNDLINNNKDPNAELEFKKDRKLEDNRRVELSTEGSGKVVNQGDSTGCEGSDREEQVGFTCSDRRNLINAIIFDDLPKIRTFIEYPCDLFEKGCDHHFDMEGDDYFLFSPIYIVANLGKLPILKLIATNKNINFDVKSGPFHTTPLMGAVKGGHYQVVYYMLTIHSLDINTLDAMGNNCLYYSIQWSKNYDFKIVELLLNFGVKVQQSTRSQSLLDILINIPGKTKLHRKLLDVYKLQSLVIHQTNWPLLQNLQVAMSSKLHVKYKIKIDPPTLGPPVRTSSPKVPSPGFLSPDRSVELENKEETSVLKMMGNLLGSIGDEVVQSFMTKMDEFTDAFVQTANLVTSPTTRLTSTNTNVGSNFTSLSNNFNSIISGISPMNTSLSNTYVNGIASNTESDLLDYLIESIEIIRRDLFKMASGIHQMGILTRTVSNEMNLVPKELISYYLGNILKILGEQVQDNNLIKNFTILTNDLLKDLTNSTHDNAQLMIRYINYENQLVSFGVACTELTFTRRLEKNGSLLMDLGIIDSFAQNSGNFLYITTNEDLMQIGQKSKKIYPRKRVKGTNIRASGNLYLLDSLRLAINQSVTFDIDRCLVSLVDLLRNSNKKLVSLAKILIFSNSCEDVQRFLPPADSQLWSTVNMTIENIFNNVHTLRKNIVELIRNCPLSHIDLQLLHTLLWKSLQELDILKNLEIDRNVPVESRLTSILEELDIAPPDSGYSRNQRPKTEPRNINLNYTFNFTEESEYNQNNMSIRPLSSPHLINRIDTDFHIPHPTSASRLYEDILNNTTEEQEPNVSNLNQSQDPSTEPRVLSENLNTNQTSQNGKDLETHSNPNGDGPRDGRDTSPDYLFYCVSLLILGDRLKYLDILSEIFRNVIPVVSTILNQPKIEYRCMSSILTQPSKIYYGKDDKIKESNIYGVCMGPKMPIHYSYYLKNKPLIKRTVIKQMYDKIFSLKTLSLDRPYFSIRVDRGIAHTTKLLKNTIWFQSTNQILNCNPNILRAKNNQRPFMVVFKGEGSTDFGGPFQELLTCISNEFMSPLTPENESQTATVKCQNTINNYGMHQDTILIKFSNWPVCKLFNDVENEENEKEELEKKELLFTMGCCDLGVTCSSGCCCILSSVPTEDPENEKDFGSKCKCGASELYTETCNQKIPMELNMYESLGRLCAMCVSMMNPLNIAINPIIWKKILCNNINIVDLLDCDKMSVDLLQKLKTLNTIGKIKNEELDGLVFSMEGSEGVTVDLVENGTNKGVEPENLEKYIKIATLFKLTEGDLGCTFLAKGINSVLPIGRLRTLLDPRSLEFVVCGDSIVDLGVLRAHTVSYSINLKRDLFDVLARFNNEMLQLFLRFVSGRSRLPHPNSDWCLRLEYDNRTDSDPDSRLPTSATCSFRLHMPKYSSLDVMHERLIYAIENCIAIDLDAHVVHDEMQLSIN